MSWFATPPPLPPGTAFAFSDGAERAAVFVDMDGTLVEDVPHNVDPAQLRFLPNAFAGLRRLRDAGFALVVVTSQPGLAQQRFTRQAFARLEAALLARLADEGLAFEGVHLCPHLPQSHPGSACLCRKPAPGLLRQAAIAHRLHLPDSWMVGDLLDDVEAGHRAGCRSVLVDVGNETAWRQSPLRVPDHRCADLLAAAEFIVTAGPRAAVRAAQARSPAPASRLALSSLAAAWSMTP